MGTKTLSELLSDRDYIAMDLKAMIDAATDPWGIYVSHFPSPITIPNQIYL